MRPANIVTSVADVLAGIAITGWLVSEPLDSRFFFPASLLCLATVGLYGGGVVFNDVFDAKLDRVERPERPIPSGLIPLRQAALLGFILLAAGIALAFSANTISGRLAVLIAGAALFYNKWSKHHVLAGPLNMGLCRGLNLLLGISLFPFQLDLWWQVAIVPIIYIAAITMISRGEVHGGKKTTLYFAALLYAAVIGCIMYYATLRDTLTVAILFLIPFAYMIYRPLYLAMQNPVGKNIGLAVKAGVVALILMDAAWAAAFGSLITAGIIVLLLPLSLKLGKLFAVT